MRINTHWKHRWYQNALHMNRVPPSLAGHRSQGFIVFNFSIHFPSFAQDGAPQPSCNPLFFLTLVMGWDYFSPPKAQLGPYFGLGAHFAAGFYQGLAFAFGPLSPQARASL